MTAQQIAHSIASTVQWDEDFEESLSEAIAKAIEDAIAETKQKCVVALEDESATLYEKSQNAEGIEEYILGIKANATGDAKRIIQGIK